MHEPRQRLEKGKEQKKFEPDLSAHLPCLFFPIPDIQQLEQLLFIHSQRSIKYLTEHWTKVYIFLKGKLLAFKNVMVNFMCQFGHRTPRLNIISRVCL